MFRLPAAGSACLRKEMVLELSVSLLPSERHCLGLMTTYCDVSEYACAIVLCSSVLASSKARRENFIGANLAP